MTTESSPPPDKMPRARRPGLFAHLRGNFLTGLVIIAPIGLTVYLVWWIAGMIDGWVLPWVPERYLPANYIGTDIRGIGVVIFLIFATLVGYVGKGLIGRSFIHWGERVVNRMPVVRSLYSGLKQIVETVLSQSDKNFEKACLVEYPRRGIWCIAFVATEAKSEMRAKVPVEDRILSVFLPTTPNPTSGFLLFVPEKDVIFLEMSVEDAAKLVISAGLVYPNGKDPKSPPQPAPIAAQ